MLRLQGMLRKIKWRVRARKMAMGRLRPRLRSPRRESRRVIVCVFGWGERWAKKLRRRWKGLFAVAMVGDG